MMNEYLYIDGKMNYREQKNRIIVNNVIDRMKKVGRFNENEFKNWLLNQVTGLEIDGQVIIWEETFTYDEAVGYFNEIVSTGCFK